ncbi:uncharacterized protein EHS24_002659 [Apiotrichum porosum]|uniref:Uncharacterized protein n=1 Tax=Apiotrichum porosum TaxID=105984 RepID=A0A427XH64_9TREE|nr:uncharacterized protein EHS24_002659 [Apiotrichum porosum]RSH78198.1 hypothetical protein EHS24_002659 [Apiotrichum porosum]
MAGPGGRGSGLGRTSSHASSLQRFSGETKRYSGQYDEYKMFELGSDYTHSGRTSGLGLTLGNTSDSATTRCHNRLSYIDSPSKRRSRQLDVLHEYDEDDDPFAATAGSRATGRSHKNRDKRSTQGTRPRRRSSVRSNHSGRSVGSGSGSDTSASASLSKRLKHRRLASYRAFTSTVKSLPSKDPRHTPHHRRSTLRKVRRVDGWDLIRSGDVAGWDVSCDAGCNRTQV